ncbi:topoisomerase IV [Paraglaciecola arctica]|uniref:topoisomerase IV n=1 Tax=Paraglaciecola arctica TaxID=1128911 RepID=UPI001C068889|nr:topoisomerase IV [Paraglaciecola arctica]MBU3004688.1 topoisomerase IV [Paraglaciecola arctica]
MKKLLTIAALTSCVFSTQAEVRINGFANFVGGMTSSEDSLYGYDDSLSFSEESLFAIQISGDVNDKMTATGQIVAKGTNDYDPEFEWAYLTYQATDNLSISAGRLRLPLFRYSSSKDVGYSYHWVNTPQSVYGVAFNNIEGFRFDYSNYAGDWEYAFQLTGGTINSSIDVTDLQGNPQPVELESNNSVVFTAEATYEWFKIRAVAGRGTTTFLPGSLEPSLELLPTNIADSLRMDEDTANFYGLGFEVDNFDWFVSGEITSIDIEESFSPKDTAYYLTAGVRTGKFTPSITHEVFDGEAEIRFLDQVAALPEDLSAPVGAAVTTIQQLFSTKYSLSTIGVRYDMSTNVALKADVSKYDDDIDESADATLVRFAVNYVF